jgi:hypothetical protein
LLKESVHLASQDAPFEELLPLLAQKPQQAEML